MADFDIVKIEITRPLPSEGVVNATYNIEGNARVVKIVGAPPWVYAQVQKKDWYKPEIIEETTYERGLPIPISGRFTIDWEPTKEGIFEVTVIATPAPLSLPVIGLIPVTGSSDVMKIAVAKVAVDIKGVEIISYVKVT